MGSKKKKLKAEKDRLEKGVVAIAEQLGWFLGTVRAKADGLMENEAVAKQVSAIRDGAMDLLGRVNKATSSAQESVKAAVAPAVEAAKSGVAKAKKSVAKPASKPAAKKAARSGGTVDAPGKQHRKPPPQEAINKRMGEAAGKKAGQKQFKVGKSRGRG